MITRRGFLKSLGALALTGFATTAYAGWIEPMWLTRVKQYAFTPPNWNNAPALRIAILADIHACRPWMPPERIASIVAQTNALKPDLILLLGDYVHGTNLIREEVLSKEWAAELGALTAPLGVYSVLGNHDWWEDIAIQKGGAGLPIAGRALESVGIPVLHNEARSLSKEGHRFWLAGLGDQLALRPGKRFARDGFKSLADLSGTLDGVSYGEPVILMAHEPDIFPRVPSSVSLTLSGHTHGGQVNLLGWTPVVPSHYGSRYRYGHIVEDGRHLLVSGGLGMSILPVRFGVRPEIVLLELGKQAVS